MYSKNDIKKTEQLLSTLMLVILVRERHLQMKEQEEVYRKTNIAQMKNNFFLQNLH